MPRVGPCRFLHALDDCLHNRWRRLYPTQKRETSDPARDTGLERRDADRHDLAIVRRSVLAHGDVLDLLALERGLELEELILGTRENNGVCAVCGHTEGRGFSGGVNALRAEKADREVGSREDVVLVVCLTRAG